MSLPSLYEYMPLPAAMTLVKSAGAGKAIGTAVKGLAAFGLGSAAGAGTGLLVDKAYQAATGEKLPTSLLVPASTLLGAGMGLAYSMYKSKELEEMQSALKERRNKSQGSLSRK